MIKLFSPRRLSVNGHVSSKTNQVYTMIFVTTIIQQLCEKMFGVTYEGAQSIAGLISKFVPDGGKE